MAMIDSIRQAARAQPFRPFTVHMVDGTDYVIEHPDFLMIPPLKALGRSISTPSIAAIRTATTTPRIGSTSASSRA